MEKIIATETFNNQGPLENMASYNRSSEFQQNIPVNSESPVGDNVVAVILATFFVYILLHVCICFVIYYCKSRRAHKKKKQKNLNVMKVYHNLNKYPQDVMIDVDTSQGFANLMQVSPALSDEVEGINSTRTEEPYLIPYKDQAAAAIHVNTRERTSKAIQRDETLVSSDTRKYLKNMNSHSNTINYPAAVVINVNSSPGSPRPKKAQTPILYDSRANDRCDCRCYVESYHSANSTSTETDNDDTNQGSSRRTEAKFPILSGLDVNTKQNSSSSLNYWPNQQKHYLDSFTDSDTSQRAPTLIQTNNPVTSDQNIYDRQCSSSTLSSWSIPQKHHSTSVTDANTSQRAATLIQANNPVTSDQNIYVRQCSSSTLSSWSIPQKHHSTSFDGATKIQKFKKRCRAKFSVLNEQIPNEEDESSSSLFWPLPKMYSETAEDGVNTTSSSCGIYETECPFCRPESSESSVLSRSPPSLSPISSSINYRKETEFPVRRPKTCGTYESESSESSVLSRSPPSLIPISSSINNRKESECPVLRPESSESSVLSRSLPSLSPISSSINYRKETEFPVHRPKTCGTYESESSESSVLSRSPPSLSPISSSITHRKETECPFCRPESSESSVLSRSPPSLSSISSSINYRKETKYPVYREINSGFPQFIGKY